MWSMRPQIFLSLAPHLIFCWNQPSYEDVLNVSENNIVVNFFLKRIILILALLNFRKIHFRNIFSGNPRSSDMGRDS